MSTHFVIPGRPVPKMRPRFGKNGCIYTPERCRVYEDRVASIARRHLAAPFEGPVLLRVRIYVAGRHGDLDNYVKSIADGLNGHAWRDDRQIMKIEADMVSARLESERAEVQVAQLYLH